MKNLVWLLAFISLAVAGAIKIDVDQFRSPDHTKVWTPPSSTTTLIGTDTNNDLTNKTLDKLVSTSEEVNAVATGANAVVTTPTSLITQLTNVSLVSVDGITAPANNQVVILKNKTGANVTINNETGVNTTYRIKTGTGANLTLATDASIILAYSTTDNRWQVVGGSGSGGGLSAWVTAHGYLTGDVVIESNKIYKALSDHTSGTFATDLAGGKWVEVSAMDGVDLSTNQTIGGIKTFSSTIVGSVNGNAATVTTNANLTGPITSTGNATAVASQTGTGSTFVMDTSPTLVTPVLGVATATSINGTTIPTSKTLQDKDALTAKGDIYVATAATTTARQAVGSNKQVLMADSAQTNGIKWADSQILTKSDVDSADIDTIKIQYPNAQVTTTATGVRRLELVHKNLLVNPSFEASTVDNGWTVTGGGTSATSTTNLQDGAASVTRTSTGAWTFYQDSTLYATAKSGQDAEASIWVYSATASANLWLCPRVNGASVTASVANGCVQYTNLGAPQKLTVYMLYGGTSTGIEVKGSGAITYILDDAYLGDRRNLVTGITTTPRTLYVPTSPNSSIGLSSTECYYERVGGNLFGDCTFTASANSASEARVSFPSGATATTFTNLKLVGYASRNNSANASNNFAVYVESGVSYFTFGLLNTSGTGAHVKQNASAIFANGDVIKFKVGPVAIAEWQGDTNAFTTKCDDPRQCAYDFTAYVDSAGNVSFEDLDWINGNCTMSTGAVTCTPNTGIFTVVPNCTVTVADSATSNAYGAKWNTNSTSSSIKYSTINTATGAGTSLPAIITCKKQGTDRTLAQLTQQIVQMRDVPRTPGSGASYIMSASVDASEAITENESILIASCTNADPSVCTFTTAFTAAPKCWANPTSAGTIAIVTARSTTTVTVDRTDASTPFTIFCQGSR